MIIHNTKWIFNDEGKVVGIHMYMKKLEMKALFASANQKQEAEHNLRGRFQRDSARDWRNMIASMGGSGVVPMRPPTGAEGGVGGGAKTQFPALGVQKGAGADSTAPGEEDLESFSVESGVSGVSGIGSLLDTIADDSSVSPNRNVQA